MELAHDPGHDPNCSGCPACNEVYAASYGDPTNMRLAAAAQAESQKPVFRAAAAPASKCECSYAPALAARAAAVRLSAKPQWPVIKDPAIENLGRKALADRIAGELWAKSHEQNPVPEPPDTYALALKARRDKENA